MVCRVARPDSRPAWRIGIEDPHDPQPVLAVVEVRRGAVATSGDRPPGRAHHRRAHRATSPGGVASVTVVADDLTWADIDATAAYAMGPEASPGYAPAPAAAAWSSGRTARARCSADLRESKAQQAPEYVVCSIAGASIDFASGRLSV